MFVHRSHQGMPFRGAPPDSLIKVSGGRTRRSIAGRSPLQLSDSAPKGKGFVIEVSLTAPLLRWRPRFREDPPQDSRSDLTLVRASCFSHDSDKSVDVWIV